MAYENDRRFEEEADLLLRLDPTVLIIPADAFNEAVTRATGRVSIHAVDRQTRLMAVRIGAAANDPRAFGIVGELTTREGPHAFNGRLFIVADDANVND